MSQQSNQKQVITYNYDPNQRSSVLQEQPINTQHSRIDSNDTPFNVSKVLKAKQQYSNIFNLPNKEVIDVSQVKQTQDEEKILPQCIFWWNSQNLNLKDNKKVQVVQQSEIQQPTQQYQQYLQQQQQFQQQQFQQQQQQQQQYQVKPNQVQLQQPIKSENPFKTLQKHNQMIETADFQQNKYQEQDNYQLQNLQKVDAKVNNPNTQLKQINQNYSDVLGDQLGAYYKDYNKKKNDNQKVDAMQESELYGPKYHQRQQLRGMSSQMDTHNYYDQLLEKQKSDQIKQNKQSPNKSIKSSPGKQLQEDELLFPKPRFIQLTIRGLGKTIEWAKLNQLLNNFHMTLSDVTPVLDKNNKVKQHKIIIKHYDDANLLQAKQWITVQGGRIVEEQIIPSEADFLKLMQLKEGPKQRPVTIVEEKRRIQEEKQKKRPKSALTTTVQNKKRPQSALPKQK